MDALPQISLGSAALVVIGTIAGLALLRGLLRILWGTLVLCLGGLAAFFAWRHAPTLSRDLLDREIASLPWLSWLLPAAAFLIAALLLRLLATTLLAPLRPPGGDSVEPRRSPLRRTATLVLSLIPAALLCFGGATLLRHAGSVAEIRAFADAGELPDHTAFLARVKTSIDRAIPADWFDHVDPLADKARLNLAKLISSAESPPPKALPVLEETQIRELILNDTGLRDLARQGRYSEILRDPRLDQLLENDNLREVLTRTTL